MRWALLVLGGLALVPSAAAEERVDLVAGAFVPDPVRAQTYETVLWRWGPNATHGIAPDDGGAAWCEPRTDGCSWSFAAVGEHRYHCPLHPELRGTVIVERRGSEPSSPTHALFTASARGLTLAFDASATAEARLAIERYSWDFGDNESGEGRIVEHTYALPGSYVVRLTVVDETGDEASSARLVVVEPAGDTMARFDVQVGAATVVLDARVAEGSHAWALGDGTSAEGASVVHTYRRAGEFVVAHTLVLPNGTFAMGDRVLVDDGATFAARADGLTLALDASALATYGNASYRWRFGDFEQAEGARIEHTFPTEGLWSVELELTDAVGTVAYARELALAPRADADARPASSSPAREPARDAPISPLLPILAALCAAHFLGPERYK